MHNVDLHQIFRSSAIEGMNQITKRRSKEIEVMNILARILKYGSVQLRKVIADIDGFHLAFA